MTTVEQGSGNQALPTYTGAAQNCLRTVFFKELSNCAKNTVKAM